MNQTITRLADIVPHAQELINRLATDLSTRQLSLLESEEQILAFVNQIGSLLLSETLKNVAEPTCAPRVQVGGRVARYKGCQMRSFRCRFGEQVHLLRRRYRFEDEAGGSVYPLDQMLGTDRCAGFSPKLSHLLTVFGATDAYGPAASRLSDALGFPVSPSAVQSTTERCGERLPHNPLRSIPKEHQGTECDLLVVQLDGCLSPQIAAQQGDSGRAVLSRPTEYKECTVVVIRKQNPGQVLFDRWYGGQYGKRERLAEYLRRGAMAMGQMQAKRTVFVADGARHNWELCWELFPDATEVLDIYHAWEHLAAFCTRYQDEGKGRRAYRRWREMLWEGQVLEVIAQMQRALFTAIGDRDEAQKHLNYFRTNRERMRYDEYRAQGLPCGSGIVEGACKSVVAKRFKGSGMRWRRADNEATLEARLAYLNGTLEEAFRPAPRPLRPLPRVERFAA